MSVNIAECYYLLSLPWLALVAWSGGDSPAADAVLSEVSQNLLPQRVASSCGDSFSDVLSPMSTRGPATVSASSSTSSYMPVPPKTTTASGNRKKAFFATNWISSKAVMVNSPRGSVSKKGVMSPKAIRPPTQRLKQERRPALVPAKKLSIAGEPCTVAPAAVVALLAQPVITLQSVAVLLEGYSTPQTLLSALAWLGVSMPSQLACTEAVYITHQKRVLSLMARCHSLGGNVSACLTCSVPRFLSFIAVYISPLPSRRKMGWISGLIWQSCVRNEVVPRSGRCSFNHTCLKWKETPMVRSGTCGCVRRQC